MSKRARHQPGFYSSLLNDVCDRDFGSKYRPKQKPVVMGVYEVERIVAKRKRGDKDEYFIQWEDYSAAENTWEPPEHLAEDLVAFFEKRSVDPVRADECRERLGLLFEKGLKTLLAYNETITMRHDVLRALFPDMPLELRGAPYLASKEELVGAGFGSYLKKCLTVTGGGCSVNTPVSFKLSLGKSPVFLDKQGRKEASRPIERVQVKFTKGYFTGDQQ